MTKTLQAKKIKNRILNTLTTFSLVFFVWIFVSWAEIGLRDPLQEPVYSQYNAWVMLVEVHNEN